MSAPYLIELVPVDRGWILETMAQSILNESTNQPGRFRVKIVNEPTDRADLTFFLPESAFRPLKHSITVTYLAHKEDHRGAAALFEEVARKSDYCITSSTKYQQVLEADGAKKVFKIHLGVDTEMFVPKLKLGVVGRTYHTGRKGENLLAEIIGMPMVELRFTGEGWPLPADYYSTADLVGFYNEIDFLMVPSLIEGGPVPMLEALSSGCPVIAPSDIGLVEDFPHIPFQRGNAQDLRRVVEELLQEKLKLRASALENDWSSFAKRHLEVFAEIIESRRASGGTAAVSPVPVADKQVRVLLVTHGPEDAAKGGPSTRVRLIASQLRAQEHYVDVCHNIQSPDDLDGYDTVHVFNSWPPQTAHQAMAIAKRAGKTVVFSPIVLDLWHWPIYRQLMESAFATAKPSVVESVVGQLPRLVQPKRYAGKAAEEPVEGIPGHFEALRSICALADHVIYLSQIERDLLAAIGANIHHGTLIHNGVAAVFAENPDPNLFKKTHGFDRYVLCVGRIEYRKNQALLAMAMRDMPVTLVLIGDEGDWGYLDHVRMVGGKQLRHFARIEDQDMLASAYAGASAFVLPSWCEGAPLAALEAGLTGVPLVLSNMSSEPEYFGEHADYISPVDIGAMRETIVRVLERKETSNQLEARKSFLRNRYSETEHVKATLALYRNAARQATDEGNDRGIILDVSSMLHSLRVGGHLTGVPLAERSIVAEIMRLRPTTRCIAFNDYKRRFIEIPFGELEAFDPERFNSRYWFAEDAEMNKADLRLEVLLPEVAPPPQLEPASPAPLAGTWPLWASRVVRMLVRAGLSRQSIDRLGYVANKIRRKVQNQGRHTGALGTHVKSTGAVDVNNILSCVSRRRVPRTSLNLVPGSRILTLGQSWLSNEPLLDCLLDLAAGHQLEAYVYDISYISGAHFSGWADNADRERRLEKLLRHCRTVFTEAKSTAAEIAKFGQTRRLSFQVVKTQLRGKEQTSLGSVDLLRLDGPFVLYVSTFNHRKNHDFIVNVWRDLIQVHGSNMKKLGIKLVLVGEVQGESKYGDAAFLECLRSVNVEVVHNVDDEQLSNLYARCLMTVYPSLQEGWGIPVQESLMHGKVCIVSSAVPAAQDLCNSALIKLSPNDFFGWREAIHTWATNEKMRFAFEAQAKQYEPPSWREIAQTILG